MAFCFATGRYTRVGVVAGHNYLSPSNRYCCDIASQYLRTRKHTKHRNMISNNGNNKHDDKTFFEEMCRWQQVWWFCNFSNGKGEELNQSGLLSCSGPSFDCSPPFVSPLVASPFCSYLMRVKFLRKTTYRFKKIPLPLALMASPIQTSHAFTMVSQLSLSLLLLT